MLYTEWKLGENSDDFNMSRFGYVIEPDGMILSLQELQVHGQIAYDRNPEVREYYDNLDEDRHNRSKTAAECFATDELGHVRISIAPYIYQWSVGHSWSKPLTDAQYEALKFLFDVCGQEDEIWDNHGMTTVQDFLRKVR